MMHPDEARLLLNARISCGVAIMAGLIVLAACASVLVKEFC